MIHILTPKGADKRILSPYRSVITHFAKQHGEDVCTIDETEANYKRIFSAVNFTNGRTLLFHPSFIPSTSFFDELDYLWDQGVYIVVPRKYKGMFNPTEDRPYRLEDDGISRDFALLQLIGQKEFKAPNEFYWKYLESPRKEIYQIESRFMGDRKSGFSMRSFLGETIPGVFGDGTLTLLGRDLLDNRVYANKATQKKLWRAAIEALSIWLK